MGVTLVGDVSGLIVSFAARSVQEPACQSIRVRCASLLRARYDDRERRYHDRAVRVDRRSDWRWFPVRLLKAHSGILVSLTQVKVSSQSACNRPMTSRRGRCGPYS